MKRFSFRLERVLAVRRLQQEQARGAWALAKGQQTAAEQMLADSRDAASAEAAGVAPGGRLSADGVQALALRASLRAQSVQIATADLAVAAEAVREQAELLQAAARKVDVLDRLESRERSDWLVEARRDEGRTLDDIAGARAALPGAISPKPSSLDPAIGVHPTAVGSEARRDAGQHAEDDAHPTRTSREWIQARVDGAAAGEPSSGRSNRGEDPR